MYHLKITSSIVFCVNVSQRTRGSPPYYILSETQEKERGNKVTDGTFTKDDDYLVIKLDPAYCWRLTDSRDCRRMAISNFFTSFIGLDVILRGRKLNVRKANSHEQ